MNCNMLKVLCAPLQGYTTGIYRAAHAKIFGGIEAYYAPFLRIENGLPRERDLRDLEIPASMPGSPRGIPQVIANSAEEFKILADALLQKGFTEIDFNMGCPFPMQVSRHRGAGLLNDTRTVQEIMDEIARLSAAGTVKFSVKMRLGHDSPDEAFALLPILNDTPLTHITLHPRLGKQQYKGAIDIKSFEKFYSECRHPLVYNGNITDVSQIQEMERRYPNLAGVMIGRGLLAQPSLASEYRTGATESKFISKLFQMHQIIFEHARQTFQGDSQILAHVQSFWDYLEPSIPKKTFKRIKKSGKLSVYADAVSTLLPENQHE